MKIPRKNLKIRHLAIHSWRDLNITEFQAMNHRRDLQEDCFGLVDSKRIESSTMSFVVLVHSPLLQTRIEINLKIQRSNLMSEKS